ncbi:MAG: serine hydrolase domain-containing protein [Wenzhouxiangella sp.]
MRLCLISLLSLLALLLLLPAHAAPEPGFTADYSRFENHFRQILEQEAVPGGAYAIIRDGRIVQAGTFGVRAAGEELPVTVDTVFRIASVSKTFAAQLTGMLVHEGHLSWEDGITGFLPDFQLGQPEQARQLQIHHLLGQSTGIVPNAYDNLLNASQSLEQIVPRFREIEPMCQPGRCYTYQNVLFSLVGAAIEQRTERSYDDLVNERLFQPLEMRDASTGMAGYLAAENRAVPHVKRRLSWRPTQVNENYYRVSPAAGVNASAIDLSHWLIAQMGHHPDIVTPALVEEITEKRIRTTRDLRRRGWRDFLTDAHYGLGWRVYTAGDDDIYLHSGWVEGFVAEIGYSRSRQTGLVVLLNAESSALNQITTSFWRQTLAEPRPVMVLEPPEPAADLGGVSAANE